MTHLLREPDVAKMMGVSVKTLQAWRFRGEGPRYAKMGRMIRYAEADIEAFISQGVIEPRNES